MKLIPNLNNFPSFDKLLKIGFRITLVVTEPVFEVDNPHAADPLFRGREFFKALFVEVF